MQVEKLVEKMRRSNKGHTFEDLERVLLYLGYKQRKGKGSHYVFIKGQKVIVIAKHKPVSPAAIDDVLDAYDN